MTCDQTYKAFICICALGARLLFPEQISIRNPLELEWPWDLTYVEVKEGEAPHAAVMPGGERRPVQMQSINGRHRAWFVATLDREPSPLVTLDDQPVSPGIQLEPLEEMYLIDNGRYRFRIRRSQTFEPPLPLTQVPHWNAGFQIRGHDQWDGRAWFEGSAEVKEIKVEILEKGPVFIDLHITYVFDTLTEGAVGALPLDMGKQTHTWEPNTPPRETVPKHHHHYEAKVRFVMGSPLVEVNERFHLPRDKNAGPFGVHQYWMSWGTPEDAPDIGGFSREDYFPVDTVSWVRWFLYDSFGGNTHQKEVEARPREDQKGRPFALLRPRWNQGGGGAQDFVVFGGGKSPPSPDWLIRRHLKGRIRTFEKEATAEQKNQIRELRASALNQSLPEAERLQAAFTLGEMVGQPVQMPSPTYHPENPAMGIIATFASKWVGPYPATIATYAYDGNRARARFPLIDGERSGMHYGQRSYAMCVGRRSDFRSLNNVVRRFTDWTLVAQMNKYVLEWERDPGLAGPSAKVTSKQLKSLQQATEAGEGPVYEILRESMKDLKSLQDRLESIQEARSELGKKRKDTSLPEEQRELADTRLKQLGRERKQVEKKLSNSDMQLLRMISTDWAPQIKVPTAQLWIERRYQDDFLNPTARTPRDIAKYADADLFSNGTPLGGPWHAALGYITTDLDAWPGWWQGWSPGNPNFHTDKYMGAIYVASAMRDHPHSKEWMAYGWDNFQEDVRKVLLEPDGTGYECPGYSGYSLMHQLQLAQIFVNAGFGNPVAENPMFKGSGRWHRKLITPYDSRIERRHAAPIGDTHRWDAGFGHGFGKLAKFYTEADPAFASEMHSTWKLLTDNGLRIKRPMKTKLLDSDPTIPEMDPKEMDWSGEVFHGFGALMRNNFGTEEESFLSVKAGPLRGHYHNDELSYHFYANGRPVSLDYNCSYTPRGDHAGLHNSMTFGHEGRVMHNDRKQQIPGMEQIFASAWPGAFAGTNEVDVFVAERRQSGLTMSPLDPDDHEFNRKYPTRETAPIVHRRWMAFVKHPEKSDWSDYLVVRDETHSQEPQQVNIHLLARTARQEGNLILAEGQYDMNMAVYVAEATDLRIEHRNWSYADEWMTTPGDEYTLREGESFEEWDQRMDSLMKNNGVNSLPLPGWKPAWKKDKDAPNPYMGLLKRTEGKAMIPPKNWNGSWMYGEYQHWLRLHTKPGTPVMWVLYPYPKGTEPPRFERLEDGKGVRVTRGEESEEVWMATDPHAEIKDQAVFVRENRPLVLLEKDQVPGLGDISPSPLDSTE